MTVKLLKDQAALTFVQNQATYIETEVDKIEYPEVQYPQLIPVDFSAPDWTKTVTYYSTDKVGKAEWFNHLARDVPKADVDRTKFETTVEMAAIGYGYTLEEISQAQAAGVALTTDRADAARQAYEEFVDETMLYGNDSKNFFGLIDYPGIAAVNAPADGAGGGGGSSLWVNKTPDQIARDFNALITGSWVDSKQVGVVDTVLLPLEDYTFLLTKRLTDQMSMTLLQWLGEVNIYTATTGRKLTIRAMRGLETAGTGDSGRMIAYRRDPKVLKAHIPMRHRWLEVMRTGPMLYEVPGIFRLGGLDVKRPTFVRYMDQIS